MTKNGTEITPHVSRYTWDPAKPPPENQIDFIFTGPVPIGTIVTPVTVKVKDYNSVDVFNEDFNATEEAIQELAIKVDLRLPGKLAISVGDGSQVDSKKRIRGKLVSLKKLCTLQ